MKNIISFWILCALLFSCDAGEKADRDAANAESSEIDNANWQDINTDEALIATALMAAPEEHRAGCTVLGYNMAGEFVTLKEGSNDMICLADNPKQDGFNAASYHKDMEPFMARGRALKEEGKSATEIFDIREEEVKAGKLEMGKTGSTLHIYYGKNTMHDPETGKVKGAKYRYVVYMPYATAASTGLPERPVAANHPWIMNPGTHRAHIMISPINEGK